MKREAGTTCLLMECSIADDVNMLQPRVSCHLDLTRSLELPIPNYRSTGREGHRGTR